MISVEEALGYNYEWISLNCYLRERIEGLKLTKLTFYDIGWPLIASLYLHIPGEYYLRFSLNATNVITLNLCYRLLKF